MKSDISGFGFASLLVERTDAKESYGPAGQKSLIAVSIFDGSATLANRSSTNYASMIDGNYGWQSNDHITVSGSSSYVINRYM